MWVNPRTGLLYEGDCQPGDRQATAAEISEWRATNVFEKTIIYKADIWRRASDAEAVIIDAALNAQPIRLRRMWQDSQTLATTDEMYPVVLQAFQAAFGVERAKELLEPTA